VKNLNKAIFLDRDGTIIIDKHYLSQPEEVEFIDGALESLRWLHSQGFKLYIITNQSGIGRGYFTEAQMHLVHDHMEKLLNDENINLSGIAHCPHSPDEHCECRKPSPKLILDFIKRDQIDAAHSFMIGDKESDVISGENAGTQGILLTSNPKNKNEFISLVEFCESLK